MFGREQHHRKERPSEMHDLQMPSTFRCRSGELDQEKYLFDWSTPGLCQHVLPPRSTAMRDCANKKSSG